MMRRALRAGRCLVVPIIVRLTVVVHGSHCWNPIIQSFLTFACGITTEAYDNCCHQD